MKRIALIVTVTAILGAATGNLLAQPPGGFGGSRVFGGGFGAGLRSGIMGLLMIPEVRTELNLTEEQHQKLRIALVGLWPEPREEFGNLSEDERHELQKLREARQYRIDEAVKSVLLEEQYTRLRQLEIQRQGVTALGRLEVAEKLGLTDEQKARMREIQEAARPDLSTFSNLRDTSPEAREKMREKALAELIAKREKANADVIALLNAEQKAIWESMVGKKFEFPASQ